MIAYESVATASERTSLSPDTVRRAIRRGDLDACRVGRRLVLRVADVDQWISRKGVPA